MTENSPHPPPQRCYFEGRECMQCRGSVGGCQLPQGSASCLLLFLFHLPWPQHLLGPLSPLEKSFDS